MQSTSHISEIRKLRLVPSADTALRTYVMSLTHNTTPTYSTTCRKLSGSYTVHCTVFKLQQLETKAPQRREKAAPVRDRSVRDLCWSVFIDFRLISAHLRSVHQSVQATVQGPVCPQLPCKTPHAHYCLSIVVK